MALIAAGSYASTGGAYRDSSVKKLAALRGAATNLIRTLGQLTSADEDEDEDDTGVEQSTFTTERRHLWDIPAYLRSRLRGSSPV